MLINRFVVMFFLVTLGVSAQAQKLLLNDKLQLCPAAEASFIAYGEGDDSTHQLFVIVNRADHTVFIIADFTDSTMRVLDGDFALYYHGHGQKTSGHYSKGKKTGTWITWNTEGELTNLVYYKDGVKVSTPFVPRKPVATFPGGREAWSRYIHNAITRKVDYATEFPELSTCVVRFVVNADGSVSGAHAITMKGTQIAHSIEKAIMEGPHWMPAMENGQYVSSKEILVVPVGTME
jgi:hypothetical protein